jgi:hypothetical protein
MATSTQLQTIPGLWVTERVYAEIHSLTKNTLANWRWRDRRAGRKEAEEGKPQYKRFGHSVRYWVSGESAAAAKVIIAAGLEDS